MCARAALLIQAFTRFCAGFRSGFGPVSEKEEQALGYFPLGKGLIAFNGSDLGSGAWAWLRRLLAHTG
jgi:hypothetical protein